MKKIHLKRVHKLIILGAAGVLLIGGGALYAAQRNNDDKPAPVAEVSQPTTDTSDINYGPPTETEKQEAEQHKDKLVADSKKQEDTTAQKTVTPTITNAYQDKDTYYVGGYISGIVEDGGACTVTFTQGSTKVTATSQGVANVSSTNCPLTSTSRSQLPAGSWQITLSYKSSKAAGTSSAVTKIME